MSADEPEAAVPSADRPVPRSLRRRRALLVSALVLGGLVALYAAAGFWWLPRLVEKDLPPWLAQRYGLKLTIGAFRFDPFRFDVQADDLALRDPGGALLLQAERVAVGFEPTGLLHRTWRFDRIGLTGLQLHLVLEKDGTLDLVELLHRLVPPSGAPAAAPPRVVVDRIEAVRAGLRFTDLRGAAPAEATIAPIAFTLTGLSTLPGAKASHTLTATLPGAATLQSQGDLVLEPAPAATGKVELHGLQAANWLPFLRNSLRIDRLQGSADLSAGYAYTAAAGLHLDPIAVRMSDLLLAAQGVAAPLIQMQRIEATGGSVDPAGHAVTFARLDLARGTASVSLDADGRVGWSRLSSPGPAAPPGPAWRLSLAGVRLDQVALDYADRQRLPPLVATVGRIDAILALTATTGAQPDVAVGGLALQAHAIALPAATNSGPALGIDAVTVEGGSLQLAARRIAATAVSVEGGKVSVARDADGSIDWQRRFAPAPAASAAPTVTAAAGGEWHYDIARVDVGGIDLALSDRSTTPAFGYGVRVASASAQHLASDTATPVSFDAKLVAQPGGTLHASGSVKTNGADLQAALQIDRLVLDPFEPLLRRHTGVLATGGPLTLSADLRDAGGLSVDHVGIDLPALAVRRGTGVEPVFSAATLQVRGGQADLASHRVAIGRIALANGSVRARMQPDGQIEGLATAVPQRVTTPPAASSPSMPWTVRIDALKLERMAAHYADFSRPAPLHLDVDRIDLGVALQLSAGGARPQVVASDLQAQVQAASVAVDTTPPTGLTLAAASLKDGRFDLGKQQLGAAELALGGGAATIVRDGRGKVDLLEAFAAAAPASAPAAPPRPGWQYAVDTLKLQKFAIRAEDRSSGAPLLLAGQVDATVRHVANRGEAAFDARLSIDGDRGRVDATGTAAPATGDVKAHVVATAVALAPLQPLLAKNTLTVLQSGQAGADLQLSLAAGAFHASGRFDVDKLALTEAGLDANVLSFDRLAGRRVDFSSPDHRLAIGEMDLLRPVTKIAIAKDHSVNLEQLIRRDDAAASQAAAASAATAASAPAFDVAVQRLTVRDGSVDFSDQSLILPFATQVTGIAATIAGASNAVDRRADVEASGSIQTYGSASVQGSVVPTSPRTFTDLRVKFNNVRLAPFSPYTATFAGRKVESGKLWLDLAYKIDKGELLGANDVRLNDFTLGERVESPTAIDVPLDLAVSLLTDSKGEIHLSVPVRGDLDDPHFKIGDAIAHAVGNTLSRIVTAPFRLIGRLFGGGEDALASVDFAPGSSTLAPEQREKLDALVRALRERPLLALVVGAPYDEAADTLALQEVQARRELAARLGRGSAGGGSALVAFDDEATREALRAMRPPQAASSPASAPPGTDRADYEALFERIAKQQRLGAGALPILATQRATTIADYLTGQGIARGRVQTGRVQAVAARDGGTVDAPLSVAAAAAPK